MIEQGQILHGTELGDELTRLALNSDTIVEIGTWNGRGSTQCLRSGLVRPTQHIWTIETNEECHNYAKRIHEDEPRITFLLGTIVTGKEIFPAPSGSDQSAFESESKQNDASPLVFDELPERIDLLFVDGGAFSGFAEVSKLYQRSKIIVLDDIFDTKNDRSCEMLSNMKNWKMLECRNDRNGWAVFKQL